METLIISIFALLGVITHRIIGFGIALFLSPVALILFEPPVAVVTTILVGTLSCALILFQSRHNLQLVSPVIRRILITALPGSLLGAYIVTRIDKAVLQVIIGVLVIMAICIQEYKFSKPSLKLGITPGINLTGFLAGLLSPTAANGAPPIVLWMRRHVVTPDQVRQNFAGIFIWLNWFGLIAIYFQRPETYDLELAYNFALLVPVVLLGNLIGARLVRLISKSFYERLIVVLVVITGLVSIGLGSAKLLKL